MFSHAFGFCGPEKFQKHLGVLQRVANFIFQRNNILKAIISPWPFIHNFKIQIIGDQIVLFFLACNSFGSKIWTDLNSSGSKPWLEQMWGYPQANSISLSINILPFHCRNITVTGFEVPTQPGLKLSTIGYRHCIPCLTSKKNLNSETYLALRLSDNKVQNPSSLSFH